MEKRFSNFTDMAQPRFTDLFPQGKPLIGVIHLRSLPGAPLYAGEMRPVFEQALQEAELYAQMGVDGVIVENFGDAPFFPGAVPAATVAAMAAITREVRTRVACPLGVNVLRNDAEAALSIAAATDADFIRVNVHISAVLADQGLIQGKAHETLRLKRLLGSQALIFADVGVKHAAPLVDRGLLHEVRDLSERGMADALIVSGSGTGRGTSPADLKVALENSELPVLIGSGCTPENLPSMWPAHGFIVGSYFKQDGKVKNPLDPQRIQSLQTAVEERITSQP